MTTPEPGVSLETTYMFLEGSKALPIEVTESFWSELMSGEPRSEGAARVANGEGWLIMSFAATADAPAWEQHPSGDELVVCTSGAVDMVLDEPGGERIVELLPGRACLVPRGVWHRNIVRTPGNLLFITFGKGTTHRPILFP